MSKFVCSRPVHPGEILKEEIEYRGISQGKLSAQMGISLCMLNNILNEKQQITTQTAMLFDAALGIPAYILIGLQTDYDMQVASNDKVLTNRIAQIRKAVAVF